MPKSLKVKRSTRQAGRPRKNQTIPVGHTNPSPSVSSSQLPATEAHRQIISLSSPDRCEADQGQSTTSFPVDGNCIPPVSIPRTVPREIPPLIPINAQDSHTQSRPITTEDLCHAYLEALQDLRVDYHRSEEILTNEFFQQIFNLEREIGQFQ